MFFGTATLHKMFIVVHAKFLPFAVFAMIFLTPRNTLFCFRIYNKYIERNPEQMKAIASIVFGRSMLPYVIYGPPGTGKTVTVVEAIKQV